MRAAVFLTGAMILASGLAAHRLLEKTEAWAYIQGALTLGGGLIICGLFSLKMLWHGLIGAGVMALLGTTRGISNLPDAFKWLGGDRSRGFAPILELGVTAVSLVLLMMVLAELQRERTRRMLQRD